MKINFFRLSIIVALSLLSSIAQAQPHSISGIVKDAETGEGIIGVTVVEQGTTTGTTTDLDGAFSFTISNPTATLDVSFVGYKSVSVPVNSRAFIEIVLLVDMMELDEVVVIGYGVQKKKVVTGAISSVSAEEISATPVLRIDQAMQGRTAGVQITNLSGQPGEAPTVRVRGAGTTGNSEPLYIVDGMAVGGIDYLNPGDIESIDVLKDAASAAIYGARAANGVVLITTKGAKKGDMSVTYSGYYGIQNVSRTIDMLNADQYRELMNEGARNSGLTEPFDLNEIPKHNTNWQDHLFQSNAPMTNHELSVTGGTDKSSYASSMSYFSQQGIIGGEKSQFDRITGRLNSRHQVTTKFQFGSNLAYSHIVRRGIASNQSFNGAYSSALNLDPLTPLYIDDQDVLATFPYSTEPVVTTKDGRVYGISNYVGAEIVNPLALLEIENAETRVDKVVGNIFGDLEIIEGLNLRTSLGIDLAYVLNDSYRPLFYLNGAQLNVDKTSVQKNIERFYTWQWENTLSYTKQIEDHNFTGLLGMTASKSNFENLFGFNAKVPINDPNHVYLNMATDTVWNALGGAAHSALLSGFARVTYDYKSRYAFTGIIRRDGSSKFGPNQRYGIFPSLGVSWVVSDEEFFPEVDQISFVKLRASWGINGNQEIGNYQFISVMDKSRGYIFGNGREFGASPAYIENNDIHWEESEQLDIALDFGAYNNRLTATIDYYIKTTSGLLERIPIPAHVGNDPPVANVGSVQNKGVELSINWRHYFNDFGYSLGINGAYNQNKMTKIGNDEGVLPGATWAVAGMVTRTELGLPIAYFWGYETDGIFQSQAEIFQHIGKTGQVLQPNAKPGDVRFVDVNNDGRINEEDRTMIGNPTPPLTFGMNASVDYKRFDLSILLVGSYGNDVFNGAQRQDLRYTNRSTAILDRWTPENPSTTTPRYTWVDVNNNYRVSDLYVEDGSFVKVKNVQLGYTLPEVLLNRISSRTWRFYVSVENLFTFTKYTGADPEIGAMSSFNIGIDRGIYPQARTIRFGTSMTF
ncbi:SusC/RagA family TonB-linked outer membrane protein [Perlabentimonas gracilis]|uniref:SusC/RagA family TonB-linked outer membrane protein n=1 Tax=Perlabentimonas gracilis TaxID=2715279 RepID=UPI00140E5239|nr:TonB-dependent receptor [Perlabentimonas gracilis]NHB68101.1 TonB-dependent receptor [Perlabentimonas gracilis]